MTSMTGDYVKTEFQFHRPRPELVIYRAFDPLDGRILTEARMRYERRRGAMNFYTRYRRHHKRAAEKTWPDVLETREAFVTMELQYADE